MQNATVFMQIYAETAFALYICTDTSSNTRTLVKVKLSTAVT